MLCHLGTPKIEDESEETSFFLFKFSFQNIFCGNVCYTRFVLFMQYA